MKTEQLSLFSEKINNIDIVDNIIYTDSGYNWHETINGCGTGTICIVINNEPPIIQTLELCFPGLTQLNNRFELKAIEIAKEIVKERGLNNVHYYSDSKIADCWAKDKNISWVTREQNLAGIVLENQ